MREALGIYFEVLRAWLRGTKHRHPRRRINRDDVTWYDGLRRVR